MSCYLIDFLVECHIHFHIQLNLIYFPKLISSFCNYARNFQSLFVILRLQCLACLFVWKLDRPAVNRYLSGHNTDTTSLAVEEILFRLALTNAKFLPQEGVNAKLNATAHLQKTQMRVSRNWEKSLPGADYALWQKNLSIIYLLNISQIRKNRNRELETAKSCANHKRKKERKIYPKSLTEAEGDLLQYILAWNIYVYNPILMCNLNAQ